MDNKQEQFDKGQSEISERIDTILDGYFDKSSEGDIEVEEFLENHEKIVHFGKILKEKGFKPVDFILWHRLIGSSIKDSEHLIHFFDTPDKDIEKFILETFAKYL
jgi:hypothetical protein